MSAGVDPGGLGETAVVGAATGGVTAAALAGASAACCTGPVLAPIVVAVLGAGGAAWAAGLKPYTPYLFAVSGALLAFGFRTVSRQPTTCRLDRDAASPRPARAAHRIARLLLWASGLIWLGSVALAIYATYFDNPYL